MDLCEFWSGLLQCSGDFVSLLPSDPDQTARKFRRRIRHLLGVDTAVIIIDSQGRPFRKGAVGVSIGCSGIPALVDERGKEDLYHYRLRSSVIALIDGLAASASLLMGEANEGIPAVIIRA